MIDIVKIKLQNLQEFVNSEQYISLENKPISLNRVFSYTQNSNAKPDDTILYMAFSRKELIGYRTVLPDVFFLDNKYHAFAWLSGSWVHKSFRRKNISTTIFKEVYKDWDGRLMYSNYAEESKALYDKTGIFEELHTLKGYRHYNRLSFATILPQKHNIFRSSKKAIKLIDRLLNFFIELRVSKSEIISKEISIRKIEQWNKPILEFLKVFKEKELFQRNAATYQWIDKQPWIKTDKKTKLLSSNYYFSSYSISYKNDFFLVKEKNTIIGIVNISIRDKQLKVPYMYSLNKGIPAIKKYIINICKSTKIDHITIYDKSLNELLLKENFLKHKVFEQKYFVTNTLLNTFPNIKTKDIQTGDGDSVFT